MTNPRKTWSWHCFKDSNCYMLSKYLAPYGKKQCFWSQCHRASGRVLYKYTIDIPLIFFKKSFATVSKGTLGWMALTKMALTFPSAWLKFKPIPFYCEIPFLLPWTSHKLDSLITKKNVSCQLTLIIISINNSMHLTQPTDQPSETLQDFSAQPVAERCACAQDWLERGAHALRVDGREVHMRSGLISERCTNSQDWLERSAYALRNDAMSDMCYGGVRLGPDDADWAL